MNDKKTRGGEVPCLPEGPQCPVAPPCLCRSCVCCGCGVVPVPGQRDCYRRSEESLGFRGWEKAAGSAQLDV